MLKPPNTSSTFRAALGIAVVALCVSTTFAAEVVVLPGDPTWGNPPGENSGGGSSAITATAPRAGSGSVELNGDRTRFVGLGNFYDSGSKLGLLSDLQSVTFDWQIATDSTATLHSDYTPALRIHVWDNGVRSELIWEGAYNGTYGNTTKGVWYTSGTNDTFWRYVNTGNLGTTLNNGSQVNLSVDGWNNSPYFTDDAYIAGFSVGVGSTAGANYHAFVDNVAVTLADGSTTTYNFEVRNAVPEPGATFGLFSLALIGCAAARRKFSR